MFISQIASNDDAPQIVEAERDFVGYRVGLIYYDFPPWVFTVAYVVFGISVTIVFILAPPR